MGCPDGHRLTYTRMSKLLIVCDELPNVGRKQIWLIRIKTGINGNLIAALLLWHFLEIVKVHWNECDDYVGLGMIFIVQCF